MKYRSAASFFLMALLMASLSRTSPSLSKNSTPSNPSIFNEAPYLVLKFHKKITPERLVSLQGWLKKENFIYKAAGSRFVVIDPRQHSSERALKKLRTLSGLSEIQKDRLVFTRSASAEKPRQKNLHQGDSWEEKTNLKECTLTPHCQNGRNPAWAALSIGADLANEEVKEVVQQAGPSKAASVAVVDSGFDDKNQRRSIDALSLEIQKGSESSGDPLIDPDGHGTAVSSMVAAKGIGVTNQVHLKIYRVTEDFAGGSTSNALLAAAIEKACKQSDIVNVSWGSDIDDLFGVNVEDEHWYQGVLESGCLVVKAAGNAGMRNERKYNPKSSDPVVTVAATNPYENLADFSTLGQIKSPGAQTYTLLSKQHAYGKNTTQNICDSASQSPIGPVNGTSFAAPAASGIMGMVVSVLRARGLLSQPQVGKARLSPENISTIKNILHASSLGRPSGVADAYVAVQIAKSISSSHMNADPEKLASIAKQENQKQCSTPPSFKSCSEPKTCSSRISCANQGRKYFHACQPLNNEQLKDYYSLLKGLKEDELVAGIIQHLLTNPQSKALAEKELSDRWNRNINPQNIRNLHDGNVGLDTLHAASQAGLAEFVTLERFEQVLNDVEINQALGIEAPFASILAKSGEEEKFSKMLSIFLKLSNSMQESFLQKLEIGTSSGPSDSRSRLGLLFALDLHRDKLSPGLQKAVDERINSLMSDWAAGNRKFFNLLSRSHYPIFDQFIQKRPELKKLFQDSAIKLIHSPLDSSSTFSPSFPELIRYALMSPKLFSNSEREHLANGLFQAIEKLPSKESQARLGERLMSSLMDDPNLVIKDKELREKIKEYLARPSTSLPYKIIKGRDELPAKISGFSEEKSTWVQYSDQQLSHIQTELLSLNKDLQVPEPRSYAPQNAFRAIKEIDSKIMSFDEKEKHWEARIPQIKSISELLFNGMLSKDPKVAEYASQQWAMFNDALPGFVDKSPEFKTHLQQQYLRLAEKIKTDREFGSEELRNSVHKAAGTNELEAPTKNLSDAIRENQEKNKDPLIRSFAPTSPIKDSQNILERLSKTSPHHINRNLELKDLWRNSFDLNGKVFTLKGNGGAAIETLLIAAERKAFDFVSDARVLYVLNKEFFTSLPTHARVTDQNASSPTYPDQIRAVKLLSHLPIDQQRRIIGGLVTRAPAEHKFAALRFNTLLTHFKDSFPDSIHSLFKENARLGMLEWSQGRLPELNSPVHQSMNSDVMSQLQDVAASEASSMKSTLQSIQYAKMSSGWLTFALSSKELSVEEKKTLITQLLKDPSFNISNADANANFVKAALKLNAVSPPLTELKRYLIRNPLINDEIGGDFQPWLLAKNQHAVTADQKNLSGDSEFLEDFIPSLLNRLNQEFTHSRSQSHLRYSSQHPFQLIAENVLLTPQQKEALLKKVHMPLLRTLQNATNILKDASATQSFEQKRIAKSFIEALQKYKTHFQDLSGISEKLDEAIKALK